MKNVFNNQFTKCSLLALICSLQFSCGPEPKEQYQTKQPETSYYGTLEPFASEAVYFLMTDRFVDGDSSNNYPDQGGDYPSYRLAMEAEDGRKAYVGYMGGDFKGVLDNANYIKEMGFTSIWITPIVEQPDEAFSGDEPITFGGAFKDGGKTGYHGYWGVNFFKVDEHLPSENLSFKQLTEQLRDKYQLKTVLDIVLNHGSPAFSMPKQQARYGQIFDQNDQLVADHDNLAPEDLDLSKPLHQFYNNKRDLVKLSDLNAENPAVLDYFVSAYSHWIEQGADAFRIDTVKHMPHSFWKKFTDAITQKHPEFFMFAESFSFDAEIIAQHTQPENGAISVLDFPSQKALTSLFEDPNSDYKDLLPHLYLEDGPYHNSYELMSFYDNHDLKRINADTNGFIDAHNWLFTARGIPVVYYGSEIGFMKGTKEHEGSRNYLGQDKINKASSNPIHIALTSVANIRKSSIALQKGLQVNVKIAAQQAIFYRVFEHQGVYQTALVILNKGNLQASVEVEKYLSAGEWKKALTDETIIISSGDSLLATLKPHSASIWLLNSKNTNLTLKAHLDNLMK
ncbi:MAG: cyclomaltodextrin glucanotransferase [Gammaproteobacteria bacterium]|nr:MAG: cyclomaltodextrin glucanotransferase [Gammaproteobacteria bacterium]